MHILVRSDDSHVQYDDSDIAPDGRVTQPFWQLQTTETDDGYRFQVSGRPRAKALHSHVVTVPYTLTAS